MNRPLITLTIAGLLVLAAGAATAGVLDLDGDGVATYDELQTGTEALAADSDGDGLDDGREATLGTNPLAADSDEDGVDDAREREAGTDPLAGDTDGDGVPDARELDGETEATVADTDGDGLDDGTEVNGATNPTMTDTDDDRLDDAREADGATDPAVADTDGDGLVDGVELEHDASPTDADTDADGVGDGDEVQAGSDPTVADTDADGLGDATEFEIGSDPTTGDTDGDGLGDEWEHANEYPVLSADGDSDGLNDAEEREHGTDVRDADTDDDGFRDGDEVSASVLPGADPTTKDIYVEVDVLKNADVEPSFHRIVNAFEEQGINLHFRVSNTGLAGEQTIDFLEVAGERNDYLDYYETKFDNEGRGYHYLLLAPDIAESNVSGDSVLLGRAWDGQMLVQTEHGRWTDSSVMHELGHSLGLSQNAFDGIDSERYSMHEYSSVMNYNSPHDAFTYSGGDPFDEWAWIKQNMHIPSTRSLS